MRALVPRRSTRYDRSPRCTRLVPTLHPLTTISVSIYNPPISLYALFFGPADGFSTVFCDQMGRYVFATQKLVVSKTKCFRFALSLEHVCVYAHTEVCIRSSKRLTHSCARFDHARPLVHRPVARDALQQRRLPRTVLPHQPHPIPGHDRQVYVRHKLWCGTGTRQEGKRKRGVEMDM